jgi:hypothetical protein
MALTASQTRRLADIETSIAQCEHVLAVTTGVGSSHSSQGISSSFSDQQIRRAASELPVLRRVREQYEAIAAGEAIPPPPGINLSNYIPE